MLSNPIVFGVLVSLCLSLSARAQENTTEPLSLNLWNDQAPINDKEFEAVNVKITVHRSKVENCPAVIICPGGGYGTLVVGPEGHGIAKWLNQNGITGVVLEYRLPKGRAMVPLLDAQRALRTVRSRAKDWSIDPKRIGIIGFSAGGHLAATAGTHFDEGNANDSDAIDRMSSRPDFVIMVYPVIQFNEKTAGVVVKNLLGENASSEQMKRFSLEQQVNDKTPPAFLAHAVNDRMVPAEHSKAFHEAMQSKGRQSRYLELPSGDHGLDGYKGPMWDAWQKQSLEWLAQISEK
jgi:acetyl esterase/lipase